MKNFDSKTKENKFLYQDGGEIKLKEIFEDPLFDENTSWRKYTNNWALLYHLSPERKNLLRWIDLDNKNLKILELGAGCGAITSYLTSLSQKPQIVAVEGSLARSELIKLRCKNADNLKIVNKNIQDYSDDQKYDFVTLIGVMEYSGKYINDSDPFKTIIEKASSFLKTTGTLLIAIENQFGHKYLAGHNEDHYGKPFEGISDYPNYNGIRTFDKKTLQKILQNSGLSAQQWFYPFPDYKMPKVILSDLSLNNTSFEWLPLLNLPTIDYSSKQKTLFDERLFLKIMHKSNDVSFFMNSFLISASKENSAVIDKNIIASNMQFSLSPKFQDLKYFILNKINDISVVHKKFNNNKYIETITTPYFSGYNNLLHLVIDAWQQKKFEEVNNYLKLWLKLLQTKIVTTNGENINTFRNFSTSHLGIEAYIADTEFIPGDFIDLILRNCLHNKENNDIKIIDQEWKIDTTIPLKLVIDRGMYYLQLKMEQITGCKVLLSTGHWNLPLDIIKNLPEIITKPDINSLMYFEYWFQQFARSSDNLLSLNKQDSKIIKRKIITAFNKDGMKRKIISLVRKVITYTKIICQIQK